MNPKAYKAVVERRNTKVPVGLEVTFSTSRSIIRHGNKIEASNFKKDVVEAFKRQHGVDVSSVIGYIWVYGPLDKIERDRQLQEQKDDYRREFLERQRERQKEEKEHEMRLFNTQTSSQDNSYDDHDDDDYDGYDDYDDDHDDDDDDDSDDYTESSDWFDGIIIAVGIFLVILFLIGRYG